MFGLCNSMFLLCNRNKKQNTTAMERMQKYMFTNNNKVTTFTLSQDSTEFQQCTSLDVHVYEPCVRIALTDNVVEQQQQQLVNEIKDCQPIQEVIPLQLEEKIKILTIVENKPLSPIQKDTLFWCIYIAAFGYNDYIQIGRNYGVKELEIKQKIGEFIKSNPEKLKNTNYKITKATIQEIMSDFLTSQKDTNMNCLIAMTVYFNINIILINKEKQIMLEFISNTDVNELPTYVLNKDSYNKYTINEEPVTTEMIASLKQTNICLENYIKPLRSISTYKIDELNQLAERLEIEKHQKPKMYELINAKLQW